MIRVLGEVRVCAAEPGDPNDPGQPLALDRKAREVVTVLAVHAPAAIGVDELTYLLWDAPPESAVRTVRAHVSRIRAAVRSAGEPDPVASAHGEAYRLGSQVRTDLGEVARLRRQARQLAVEHRYDDAAAVLDQARRWWADDPRLPGTTAGQALLRGWVRDRRTLVGEHLEAVIHGSAPQDALGELSRLTAAEPLDEPTWVQYVTGLRACGRQAEALDAVAAARAALATIGLDPGPALRAAQASVLAGETGAPVSQPVPRRTMDSAPPVSYTGDGRTAYTLLSDGAPDLVVLNPGMITIDGLMDEPHVREALGRLGARARVVCLDRRGIGLSAPLSSEASPLDQWVDDVHRVVRDAGLGRPTLLANFDTGLVALEYAACHPGELAALVLVNCYARYQRAADYPHGLDDDTTERLIRAAVDPTQPRPLDTSALVAPSLAADPEFRAWWNRIGRRGANPTTASIVRQTATTADLRDRLSLVACPVLLLPRLLCSNVDPGHSRYLADHLPNARVVGLEGADAVWFTDPGALVEHVIGFARAQAG